MWELVVIWSTGEKNIYTYDTEEAAEQGARNMAMAMGNQISWSGVRRKVC